VRPVSKEDNAADEVRR